jgi:hypothetical protein
MADRSSGSMNGWRDTLAVVAPNTLNGMGSRRRNGIARRTSEVRSVQHAEITARFFAVESESE